MSAIYFRGIWCSIAPQMLKTTQMLQKYSSKALLTRRPDLSKLFKEIAYLCAMLGSSQHFATYPLHVHFYLQFGATVLWNCCFWSQCCCTTEPFYRSVQQWYSIVLSCAVAHSHTCFYSTLAIKVLLSLQSPCSLFALNSRAVVIHVVRVWLISFNELQLIKEQYVNIKTICQDMYATIKYIRNE